ncbi:unnamed protein product [Rotaria magnacalcarata]|uniref:FLYWCH-type domain-containing protein n=1 Tax=Rotaria magnacalcarata TaxID=392030 RepID=A0A816D0H1_9BILA|nr:unnamed protein product [Rotaria magnacalcarata]
MDLENNSMKNQHSDLLFGTSNKGKPIIIYESYFFKCNKTTESKKYWVCNEKACGVYVHTNINGEFICIKGDHNHSSNPDEVTVKLLRDKMKERILVETTSITKIYDEEIVKANISKGATALIPTVVEFTHNLRFSSRLSKKHPNIWCFIQLIQSEHVRFEHILIQLEAGTSPPKQSKKNISFQKRFETVKERFVQQQINANELSSSLSLLIGKKKQ